MFSLRLATIHTEPASIKVTMRTPNASANTLLVLSGPPPAQRRMATRAGATIAESAGSHAIYPISIGAALKIDLQRMRNALRQ
jgi:hypothetical protein